MEHNAIFLEPTSVAYEHRVRLGSYTSAEALQAAINGSGDEGFDQHVISPPQDDHTTGGDAVNGGDVSTDAPASAGATYQFNDAIDLARRALANPRSYVREVAGCTAETRIYCRYTDNAIAIDVTETG